MKTTTEKITITIDAQEALSISNAMLTGLDEFVTPTRETQGAHDLKQLLTNNFHSSFAGIHRPK